MKSSGWYFSPIIIISLIIGTTIDISIFSGSIFWNDILGYADSNTESLSVVISGLLLIAYFLQFQTQVSQQEIMKRQEQIMRAGYTPILGVTNQRFGQDEYDSSDLSAEKANEFFVDIVNNGNSTARDLHVWFGISYEPGSEDEVIPDIRSNSVPLRRIEDGSWWPSDTGGAISNASEDSITYYCKPKLTRVRGSIDYIPWTGSRTDIEISDALKLLDKAGVKQFQLVISLGYTTTTGFEDRIPLAAYKANPRKITDKYLLYNASNDNSKIDEYIENARS